MPIYSEYGKHGRYGILKNRLLSPIIFTIDEVYALYFAMLTLNAYQSTPFHLRANQLNEKFESCLSLEQIKQIHNMRKVLEFESYQHHHMSCFLDKILKSILNESCCIIDYVKHKKTEKYNVQFFKISAKFGQWYATGIEIATNQYRVFRCDRITAMEEGGEHGHFSLDELISRSLERYQSENSVSFEVEITEQAKDVFYKEHYPSMRIETGQRTIITGTYNQGEEDFIASYLMKYGNDVVEVKPESLKQLIQERISNLLQHYQML